METIRQRSVLQAVLLQTLADHPAGLPVEEVYDIIDERYRFPEEWYRQIPSAASGYEAVKAHGYSDWRAVPQEKLVELVNTESQWQNEIRWSRNDLRKQKYLDPTSPRGVWKLSTAGLAAAKSGPAKNLTAEEQQILSSRKEPPQVAATSQGSTKESRRGVRQELLGKLEILTTSMPLADLRLLVELARAVRRRSLPEESEQP